MSKKKSISEKVKAEKPSIISVFDGKSANERMSTNEIASALDIRFNDSGSIRSLFKRSIFLAALYELTNENVLQHDGYYLK